MMELAGLVIRSSAMLAAGLLFSRLLSRRSAALRHTVLAASLAAAAALGPLSLALPSWTVTMPTRVAPTDDGRLVSARSDAPTEAATTALSSATVSASASAAPTLESLVIVIWAVGVFFSAGALALGMVRITRLSRRAARVHDPRWNEMLEPIRTVFGVRRTVVLTRTNSSDLLATWGWLRPQVLLPREAVDWSADRIRIVLCHELAHIRRHDWIVQVAAELVRGVLWFNPLAWIACARLRRESELACDDEVLRAGVAGRDYAAQLLDLARQFRRRGPVWLSVTPMASPSNLERRVRAMLNPGLDRRLPSRRVVAALAVVLLLVMVPLATVRAGQAGPAPLVGTIYDVSGAVLPGVRVSVVDANEVPLEATSTATGRFDLPPIGPGKYQLNVSVPGFRTLRQEVELREPRDWERVITLQVGELKESITVRASRTSATSPGRAVPSVIRVGGNVRAPLKIRDVKPAFPASMREAGLAGVVPLEAIIATDGAVSSVRVLSAQVHPDFAIAAVDAVRQWRFTPTLLNGQAVEVVMSVTVTFDLN